MALNIVKAKSITIHAIFLQQITTRTYSKELGEQE